MTDDSRKAFRNDWVDLAEAILGEDLEREDRREIKREAKAIWKSQDREGRETVHDSILLLTALADAPGGAAVEAMGEDIARNMLLASTPEETRLGSAFFTTLSLVDPMRAWNEAAGIAATEADVEAAAALLSARPGDSDFDPERYESADYIILGAEVMADFAGYDVSGASIVSSLDAYAAGLEAAWDDLTTTQRDEALGLLQRIEAPSDETLRAVLGARDFQAAADKALEAADVEPERKAFLKQYVKMAEGLAGESFERDVKREIRKEGKEFWKDYDDASRVEAFENVARFVDAMSGPDPASAEAGRDAAFDLLWRWNEETRDDSRAFAAIDRADPLLHWHEGAGVAATMADAEALAALRRAHEGGGRFRADRHREEDVAFYARSLREDFPDASAGWAAKIARADVYAAGLEAAWDDLTAAERREALDLVDTIEFPDADVMREIVGVDDLAEATDAALRAAGFDVGPTGGGGGSGAFDQMLDTFEAGLNYSIWASNSANIDFWLGGGPG